MPNIENYRRIKSFYPVITNNCVAIFTSWDNAKQVALGQRSKYKKFLDYYKALQFLKQELSEEDWIAYGLNTKKPSFDYVLHKRQ